MNPNKKMQPLQERYGALCCTIYRSASTRSREGILYQVAFREGDKRQVRQFTQEAAARRFAQKRMAGEHACAQAGKDKPVARWWSHAEEICGQTGVLEALREWARARELVGEDLLPACRKYQEDYLGGSCTALTLEAVVQAFLGAKAKQGVDVRQAYWGRLPRLCRHFPGALFCELQTVDLNGYLREIKNAQSRNTHRKNLITLFRWAQRQGYLPQGRATAAECTDKAIERAGEVAIMGVEDLRNLISAIRSKHPQWLPALALAAFCGLRTTEVHGQRWEHIYTQENMLRVSVSKVRTPAYRNVPLPQTLAKLLDTYQPAGGAGCVCAGQVIRKIRKMARAENIHCPANGLRHSYISYALASKGVGEVAAHAGTSEGQIQRHYRQPVSLPAARQWFELAADCFR